MYTAIITLQKERKKKRRPLDVFSGRLIVGKRLWVWAYGQNYDLTCKHGINLPQILTEVQRTWVASSKPDTKQNAGEQISLTMSLSSTIILCGLLENCWYFVKNPRSRSMSNCAKLSSQTPGKIQHESYITAVMGLSASSDSWGSAARCADRELMSKVSEDLLSWNRVDFSVWHFGNLLSAYNQFLLSF